ncbi:MAG: ATP-binding cassette domain-containing protein, partial [Armatimonadaceae bacterium]
RQVVTAVGYSAEIFAGTIEENVTVGREHLDASQVRWALQLAQLDPDLVNMPDGIRTRLVAGGQNLSRGQVQRLMIARAVVDKPSLLVLDEALTGIDEGTAQRILDAIFDPSQSWTIVDISHEPAVVMRADTVHVLANGKIVESGSAATLAADSDTEFARLFPRLSKQLREAN